MLLSTIFRQNKTLKNLIRSFSSSNDNTNSSPVIFEYHQNTVKTILNKPKSLNALDMEIIRTLQSEIQKWNNSPNIKTVIFKGAGEKAFCAGGDIKALYNARREPIENSVLDSFFRESLLLYHSLSKMKPIQIALWNGITIGAGVGLSLPAAIKIATEKTSFSMPEAKIGLFLGIGGGYHFSKMRNNIGYFLGLTGHTLKGKELVQCGIADFYVKTENIANLEADIIKSGEKDITVEKLREIVKKHAEQVEGRYAYEETINKIFGKSSLEEIFKELERTAKQDDFARNLFEVVRTNSHLSAKIIYEEIKRGAGISFEESLKVDMRLANRFMAGHDFFEGVRCMLIDKVDIPNWEHSSLDTTPDTLVDNYFEKLPENLELNLQK